MANETPRNPQTPPAPQPPQTPPAPPAPAPSRPYSPEPGTEVPKQHSKNVSRAQFKPSVEPKE